MTKSVTFNRGSLRVSGIELDRPIDLVRTDNLPAPGLWPESACRQAFRADRTAIIQKDFCPGCAYRGDSSGRHAILELLSARNVAELAKTLAQDVAKRYPPAIANSPVQVVSHQRLSDILEEVFAHVTTSFGRENTLGWYKRARLGRNFRWELNELGYDKKFVDRATEGLLLRANRGTSLKS